MRIFILLLVGTAFLGPNVFSINTVFFQMSLYRLMLAIAPLLLIGSINNQKLREFTKRNNFLTYVFMLFWTIYAMISVVIVQDYSSWFRYLIFIISGVLAIWLIGLYLYKQNDFFRVFSLIEVFVTLYSLIGYYEILTGDYRFLNAGSEDYFSEALNSVGTRIPTSVFGNPNNFALFCIVGYYNSLICRKIQGNIFVRSASLIVAFSSIILLLATESRACLIGFLSSLFALGTLEVTQNFKWRKIIPFIAVAVIFLAISLGSPENFQESILPLVAIDFTGETEGSDFIRMNLILNGLAFLKESGFLGVGAGNIEYHMAHNSLFFVGETTNIHNWWMEILVSFGVIVFLGYIIIYLKNFVLLRHYALTTNDANTRYISQCLLGFMIAFVLASISASSNMTAEWLWAYWGIVYSYVNSLSSNTASSSK